MQVPVAHLKSSLIPDFPLQFSAYEKKCRRDAIAHSQKRALLRSAQEPQLGDPMRESNMYQARCELQQSRKMLILSEIERARAQPLQDPLMNPPNFYKVQFLREQRRSDSGGQHLQPRYFLDLEQQSACIGQDAGMSLYDRLSQPRVLASDLHVSALRNPSQVPSREQQLLNCARLHDYQRRHQFERDEQVARAARSACDVDPDIDYNYVKKRDELAFRATSRPHVSPGDNLQTTKYAFAPQISEVTRDLTAGRPPLLERYDQEIREMRDNRRIAQQRDAERTAAEQISQRNTPAAQRKKEIVQFHQRQRELHTRVLAHEMQHAQQLREASIREEEEVAALKEFHKRKTTSEFIASASSSQAVGSTAIRADALSDHVARVRCASAERDRVRQMTTLRE